MRDILLEQTPDGGDIEYTGGELRTTSGIETTVYLCLFGGNYDDDGSAASRKGWWGNRDEPDPAAHYRSETQYLLGTIPPVTGNLIRLAAAAKRDTMALVTGGIAVSIEATARLVAVNRVKIVVTVTRAGGAETLEYQEAWHGT